MYNGLTIFRNGVSLIGVVIESGCKIVDVSRKLVFKNVSNAMGNQIEVKLPRKT